MILLSKKGCRLIPHLLELPPLKESHWEQFPQWDSGVKNRTESPTGSRSDLNITPLPATTTTTTTGCLSSRHHSHGILCHQGSFPLFSVAALETLVF